MPLEAAPTSKGMLWTGRILSGLFVAFMLVNASIGFSKPDMVRDGFAHMGIPYGLHNAFAVIMLACILLYAIPQTSVLGAILFTGYFGGATITHLRIGEPFYFPVAVSVLAWLALYLRDSRLRALIPLRS
jgi:hypothetical protein